MPLERSNIFVYETVCTGKPLDSFLKILSVKAIEIAIKFLNLLYNYYILMVLLFFLKTDHFLFKIEVCNLHHLKAKIMNVCTGMITLIENFILKIKKSFPLTLYIKFRVYLSAGHDESDHLRHAPISATSQHSELLDIYAT